MEMIMAVLVCYEFAEAKAGTAVLCPYNSSSRDRDDVVSLTGSQNKKPTRLRVGWNFFLLL
jgi:hypothetical protein